jgi:hypothetical protein
MNLTSSIIVRLTLFFSMLQSPVSLMKDSSHLNKRDAHNKTFGYKNQGSTFLIILIK